MNYEMVDAKKLAGRVVLEEGRKNKDIVVISTDSAPRTGMTDFIAEFPDREIEVGIMEQSGLAVSSGLATQGKIPVFCAPAPFATARPFEFFKIDVGYMKQNVKVLGRNCGFNYSDLGPTHYGLEDLGLTRLIPEVVVLAPLDAGQLEEGLRAALRYEGPVYLRFRSASIAKIFEKKEFQIGRGQMIREGKDFAIIVTGEIAVNVLEAVETLTAQGFDPMVIGMPTVCPIDEEIIAKAASTGKIITVEEGFVTGGLGSAVCEVTARKCPAQVLRLGAPMKYIPAGQFQEELEFCGLDPAGLVKSITEFVK